MCCICFILGANDLKQRPSSPNTNIRNMKRLEYISELHKWLIDNPELYVQRLLPSCILKELYYFERLHNERES